MENLFKRFVVSYFGLTIAFWLLSYAMTENGFAQPRNLAWRLISGINHFFTWGLILSACIIVFGYVALRISEFTEGKKQAEIARVKAIEAGIRESEARARYMREEAEKKEEERLKKIAWKKEREDWLRQQEIKKQKRSAADANRAALDDF